MIDIRMPEIGEGVTQATIIQWNFRPGEPVKAGDMLLEIMTDKVNVEVPCEQDGVLAEILHDADVEVRIGEVIGRIKP